jgi:type IV secretion system protein TrbI
MLAARTIIPAAFINGIDADLPDQVLASVTENVYDTATGRQPLISRCSRLLGQYDSQSLSVSNAYCWGGHD